MYYSAQIYFQDTPIMKNPCDPDLHGPDCECDCDDQCRKCSLIKEGAETVVKKDAIYTTYTK